jgi:hypothetical protein
MGRFDCFNFGPNQSKTYVKKAEDFLDHLLSCCVQFLRINFFIDCTAQGKWTEIFFALILAVLLSQFLHMIAKLDQIFKISVILCIAATQYTLCLPLMPHVLHLWVEAQDLQNDAVIFSCIEMSRIRPRKVKGAE